MPDYAVDVHTDLWMSNSSVDVQFVLTVDVQFVLTRWVSNSSVDA